MFFILKMFSESFEGFSVTPLLSGFIGGFKSAQEESFLLRIELFRHIVWMCVVSIVNKDVVKRR